MSESESPTRSAAEHGVTIEDVHQIAGAATPHFALQLRNRIAKLIAPLPDADPVRVEGERAIADLERMSLEGETHNDAVVVGEEPLPPLGAAARSTGA